MSDFKEGLVIATGGEGEEGEKVNLKICLVREIFHKKYYVAVFFQFSPLKGP